MIYGYIGSGGMVIFLIGFFGGLFSLLYFFKNKLYRFNWGALLYKNSTGAIIFGVSPLIFSPLKIIGAMFLFFPISIIGYLGLTLGSDTNSMMFFSSLLSMIILGMVGAYVQSKGWLRFIGIR